MEMYSSDAAAEEIRQFEYELDKEGFIDYYRQQRWEKSGLKRFLINSLLHMSDPVERLELIKNDYKLKLTKDEWEYARKTAFECLKEHMIKEYAVTKEELESDEMKDYFETIGFADFVKNKHESTGKQLYI